VAVQLWYAEILVSVGGMLAPGALAKVGDLSIMKKLDDFVPPLTVDTSKVVGTVIAVAHYGLNLFRCVSAHQFSSRFHTRYYHDFQLII
jgi:hypothetical protein